MVALFTEMYGTLLTIYLLGSWLGNQSPLLTDSHAGGHLWNDLTNWQGDPHLSPFHLASYVAIGTGFWLIAAAWNVLHEAAQNDRLATTGPYAWVRHPQYDGFLFIMIGFLLPWPVVRNPWIGRSRPTGRTHWPIQRRHRWTDRGVSRARNDLRSRGRCRTIVQALVSVPARQRRSGCQRFH